MAFDIGSIIGHIKLDTAAAQSAAGEFVDTMTGVGDVASKAAGGIDTVQGAVDGVQSSFVSLGATSDEYAANMKLVQDASAGAVGEITLAGDAAAGTTDTLITAGGAAEGAGAAAAEGSGGFDLLGGSMLKSLAPLAALFVSYEGLKAVFSAGTEEANLYNSAQAQIGNTLKNTKDAIGLTVTQLDDMAVSNSKNTDISKAANLAAENTLLNFQSIGKDVFPLAAGQIDNVATAMANLKGRAVPDADDTAQAAKFLGKALEDPATGMTTFTRAGIKFSADQIAAVKDMEKTSGVAAAQKLLMSDLSDVVAGKASTALDTYQGKVAFVQKTLADYAATIVDKVQGALESMAHGLANVGTYILQHKALLEGLTGALIGVAVLGIGALINALAAAAVAAATAALPFLPFIAAAAAIGAVAALVIANWSKVKPIFEPIVNIFNDVKTAFSIILTAFKGGDATMTGASMAWMGFANAMMTVHDVAMDLWNKVLVPIINIIKKNLGDALKEAEKSLSGSLGPALETIKSAFQNIGKAISPIMPYLKYFAMAIGIIIALPFVAVIGAFIGVVIVLSKALQLAAPFIGDVVDVIAFLITVVVDVAAILIGVFVQAIIATVNAIVGFINGTRTAVNQIIGFFEMLYNTTASLLAGIGGFFKNLPGNILDAIGNLGNLLYNVGVSIIQGLINGVKSMIGAAGDAVKSVANGAVSAVKNVLGIKSPSTVFAGIGTDTIQGLANGVTAATGTAKAAVASVASGMVAAASGVTLPVPAVTPSGAAAGNIVPGAPGSVTTGSQPGSVTLQVQGDLNIGGDYDVDQMMSRMQRNIELQNQGGSAI